jgi:hypothetical protein
MANLLKSKTAAWCAFILILLVMIFTFGMREAWWTFIDVFFAFMMVFSQLMALYIEKLDVRACRKLQMCAAVFGVLTILALIGEYIAYQVLFK